MSDQCPDIQKLFFAVRYGMQKHNVQSKLKKERKKSKLPVAQALRPEYAYNCYHWKENTLMFVEKLK